MCGKQLEEAFVVHPCIASRSPAPPAPLAPTSVARRAPDIAQPRSGGVAGLLRVLGWIELAAATLAALFLGLRFSEDLIGLIVGVLFGGLVLAALCWGVAETLERALAIEGRVRELEIAEAERRNRAA